MSRPLLALTGKRFSGKDTLAALLEANVRARGRQLALHAFARESKWMFARSVGGMVDPQRLATDRDYEERWRPDLTAFTVAALAKDPLVFCRCVADRIEESDPQTLHLITDVRLLLEVQHLRSRFDMRLLRVLRSDAARSASGWSPVPAVDDHPTETELDDPALWDLSVTNDGSLDDLKVTAESILAGWLPPRAG